MKKTNITGMIEFPEIKETYELSGGITQNNLDNVYFNLRRSQPLHKIDGENKKNLLSGNFVMKGPPPLWELSRLS